MRTKLIHCRYKQTSTAKYYETPAQTFYGNAFPLRQRICCSILTMDLARVFMFIQNYPLELIKSEKNWSSRKIVLSHKYFTTILYVFFYKTKSFVKLYWVFWQNSLKNLFQGILQYTCLFSSPTKYIFIYGYV